MECESGFQPRQLISRLEAAPTVILYSGSLDFPDKQRISLSLMKWTPPLIHQFVNAPFLKTELRHLARVTST